MADEDIIRQLKDNREEHKTFMEKLDDLSKGLNEIKVQLAGLPEKLTEKFDEKYANKETEIAVKRLMWIVVTAVVGAILSLVLIKF